MNLIHQSLQENDLPSFGEFIGRLSTATWVMLKVVTIITLADVNLMFTIAVSTVTFFYIALKTWNQLTIALEKWREKQKEKKKPE